MSPPPKSYASAVQSATTKNVKPWSHVHRQTVDRATCLVIHVRYVCTCVSHDWFGTGSEDLYECSAIVAIVYVCKWRCSPTWQFPSRESVTWWSLLFSLFMCCSVLWLLDAVCAWGSVVSQWVLNLSNPSSRGLPQSSTKPLQVW